MADSSDIDDCAVTFAQKIKDRRTAKNLSQETLAAMVGVSTDTIRKIEQQKTASPGVFLIVDIAMALKLDLKKLVSAAKFHPTGTTQFQNSGTTRFQITGTTQFHVSGTTED